jgi:hypothetical protein
MGMPFGYPRISIPGPAHDGSGQEQGLEDDLETKKEGSNPYSTRTLVKPSPGCIYINQAGAALEGHRNLDIRNIIDIEYHRHAILERQER